MMGHHHSEVGFFTFVCRGCFLPQFSEPVVFTFEFSHLSYNERTDDQTIKKLKYWNGVFKKGRSHLNNASEWMCTPPVPFFIL